MYLDSNKTVLFFKNKAADFLKAYTSNILEAPRNAFLDRNGKIVATFDQLKISPDEIYAVLEKPFEERLLKHLEKFLAFSATQIERTKLHVYYDLERKHVLEKGEFEIISEKTRLILSGKILKSKVTKEEFNLYRLKHNLPVQGIDYDEEMLLNVGNEEYVNYDKGCYLGQEIIARVHYKSRPPRRLIVTSESPQTSVTVDPATGKSMGFAFITL